MYSCNPPLYIPNTTNTPSLLEKGDSELNFSTGTNGYDGQFSTAINDNIGIMLNTSYASNIRDSSSNNNKHLFFETGIGYLSLINSDEISEDKMNYFYSIFGGYGFGKSEGMSLYTYWNANDNGHIYSIRGNYSRIFFQPTMGMQNNIIELMFALRFSYVNFNSIERYYNNKWQLAEANSTKMSNIFYEPTVTFKVGSRYFKTFVQSGISIPSFNESETYFRNRPFIAIVGIQGNFNWNK